ncbi:Alpha/Beta hydrolase protein [Staphylotrichum tortipilum]|uniref:Carboxylic ester hydrolase n=1 Tax=Staphylotrichum tortipilum TaxID=2831512 RepID=A0AAN6MNJ3_9PEZI|nr:Alpha/Beta hydrolase protein [Staphylotrichum longicolle]
MKSLALFCAGAALLHLGGAAPVVNDPWHLVRYHGLDRNGIEVFLGIRYGQDTGGSNRFRPPKRPIVAQGGPITYMATSPGPSCPQPLGPWVPPITLGNITEVSEDCLRLNVARPKNTRPDARLPVMVYIHGGSFWAGNNHDPNIQPDGLVLESVRNGLPVMHVAMNYRLGFFGFAQSEALRAEGSENAGLRDQRLAIEWVRDNIARFGGDPHKITIFGQSSGGLAVGLQIMAYGATKPVPFQQAICQSQALEPGITGNFTADAMRALVDHVGCDAAQLDSAQTLACLRSLPMQTLLDSAIATYQSDIAHNIGDIWLPSVDGDFLPSAPSHLIRHGRFANITTMIGWCDNDVTFFTDPAIQTPADTRAFISSYLPDLSPSNLATLLSLYPSASFPSTPTLSSEFFRAARVFRDVLMTCQPVWYASHLARAGNPVYLYDWNQTILEPALEQITGKAGWGPVHTSEFAYVFANLSSYNVSGYPFKPTEGDRRLAVRGSRSWSTFAATGRPGREEGEMFRGFKEAFVDGGVEEEGFRVFVAGGPHEGLSAVSGREASPAVGAQRLAERCALVNSPEVIEQLRY